MLWICFTRHAGFTKHYLVNEFGFSGDNHKNGHFNKILWCLTHWVRSDFCSNSTACGMQQKLSPLRDPLAPFPSDGERLATSNYIPRRSTPLRWWGAFLWRALFWISRAPSMLDLGSPAKLGPGERCWWCGERRLGCYHTETARGIKTLSGRKQ